MDVHLLKLLDEYKYRLSWIQEVNIRGATLNLSFLKDRILSTEKDKVLK
jgi:hypothetical protein